MKSFAFGVFPIFPGDIQQVNCSDDIGVNKVKRGKNRTVNMTFGGKMNDAIGNMLFEDSFKVICVEDISFLKKLVWRMFNVPKILQVPGVRQCIQVNNPVAGIFRNKPAHHM